jgi:arylsulfatase A-like enzyme
MSAVLGLLACGSAPDPPAAAVAPAPTRGYILISFDTLRADHLGAYGYDRDTSPFIDELASRGTLFERATVQYPSTLTSHISIFTGLYPQEHRVLPPSAVLSPVVETLPERFRRHGFQTAGHTEGGFVGGGYGFGRGFEQFTDTPYSSDSDIERTFDRGLEFLSSLAEDQRFFVFLHTYAVHDPYEPPAPYDGLFWEGDPPSAVDSSGEHLRQFNQGKRAVSNAVVRYWEAQYDATIRYVDSVLEGFVGRLDEMGLLAETTLILTSDHGEEFLEHGKLAHMQVYPECLFVPLVVVHPAQREGRRVADIVESVDLAPTLYELAGLPPAEKVSGRSLVPYLSQSQPDGSDHQGYAEVLETESARTLLTRQPGESFQLVLVEPEPDPVGPWIRGAVTFDARGRWLRFEAQSFHQPRRVGVTIDGVRKEDLLLRTSWTPVTLELPWKGGPHRVTLEADGCVSPREVGASDDGRCLAFQVRGFRPRRLELYDLSRDPLAQTDLFRDLPRVASRLEETLLGLRWRSVAVPEEQELTREAKENLKALGYLD